MEELPKIHFRDPQQWVQFGLLVLIALLVLIGCIGTGQHLADAQFIGPNELKRSVGQLESYAAEAQVIDNYSHNGEALRSYTEAYSSSLKKATDSVAEKLTDHAHDRNLSAKTAAVIAMANGLSAHLGQYIHQPTRQLPGARASSHYYDTLSSRLQNLDESL